MNKKNENANSLNVLKGCTLETNCITLQDGQTAKISVENGKTKIMIEHKEEEPKFKKGDVVLLEAQGDGKIYQHILIIKKMEEDNSVYFSNDFCINDNELYHEHESMWFSKENIKSIRYVTEEENRTLFLAMLNKGMFWDENKMKVRTLKDGDVITIKDRNGFIYYSIFKKIDGTVILDYIGLCGSNIYTNNNGVCLIDEVSSIRYSTTEERQTLFDKIEEQKHKRWNSETKEFENIRWRAKKGGDYWIIVSEGNVCCTTELNYNLDDEAYSFGNYFKTKELAEAAAVKIKELLSKL